MVKRTILIGATGGIGRLLAQELTNSGYYVVGVGRREQVLLSMQKEGTIKEYIVADITTEEGREKIVNSLNNGDILIYNQGLIDPQRLEETEESLIYKILDVNLISIMLLDRKIVLRGIDLDKIVYIASISSLQSWAGGAAYQASKTGLLAYISAMRLQDKAVGRRVQRIAIYPDTIKAGGMDKGLEQYPKIDGRTFVKYTVKIINSEYKGTDFLFMIDPDDKVRMYRLITDYWFRRPQALSREFIEELGPAVY